MENPTTNSLQAVRLAKERAVSPTDWPQIIHLDEEDRPLPKNQGGGAAFIVVHRRAGDPTPTDEDIRTAQASADVASRLDRRLVDYIIIGTEAGPMPVTLQEQPSGSCERKKLKFSMVALMPTTPSTSRSS